MTASFADPYLLIFRDDSSLLLLQSDESGDLDLLSDSDVLSSRKWQCGCLYTDIAGVFSQIAGKMTFMFLLSAEGRVFVRWTLPSPLCEVMPNDGPGFSTS